MEVGREAGREKGEGKRNRNGKGKDVERQVGRK
jgi:hypothetical protein